MDTFFFFLHVFVLMMHICFVGWFERLFEKLCCRTLTHALVPLVVLNIALRAAAAETTQHVLASVLASVVPCALVHICNATSVFYIFTYFIITLVTTNTIIKQRSRIKISLNYFKCVYYYYLIFLGELVFSNKTGIFSNTFSMWL